MYINCEFVLPLNSKLNILIIGARPPKEFQLH